jgi:NAD(P)-dependent dehydrogenase (short-subunit alcohol dehydrogenase family)
VADVLVNNAGVRLLGPFDTDQRDDYRRMIEVNLLGASNDHRGVPRPADGRRRRARGRHRRGHRLRPQPPRHLAINEVLLRPPDSSDTDH